MTDCTKYQQLISSYIDGEISAEEKDELTEHLKNCPSCTSLLNAYEALFSDMSQDFVEPPQQLVSGVMDKIRSDENAAIKATPTKVNSKNTKKRNVWVKYFAAAACVALVLFTAPKIMEHSSSSSLPDAAASETMDSGDDVMAEDSVETALPPEFNENAGSDTSAKSEDTDGAPTSPPAGDAAADTAPAENNRDDNAAGSATIYISGDLPEVLSSYPQTDLGDGTFSISVSEDIANTLSEMGYSIEYSDVGGPEYAEYTVIYTPAQE